MREIKFRAWHRESEQMSHSFTLFDITDGFIVFEEDPYVFGYKDDVELMQFTGLKDKNGVEIYEGDVLEMREKGLRYEKNQQSKYVVEWSEDQGCFGYKHIGSSVFVCRKTGNIATKSYFSNPNKIGNIYENPELLEV